MSSAALNSGLAIALVCAAACSRPVKTARLSRFEAPSHEEYEAAARVHYRSCSHRWGLLFPGLGHACLGMPAEASVLGALGAAEVATAVTAATRGGHGLDHPAVSIPLLALQDLYVYGALHPQLVSDLAQQKLYTPKDSTADLALAPFNLQVLKRPSVWAGLIGALAVGIGVSYLIDDPDTSGFGDDPNLFGETVDGRWGYPAAGLTGAALFTHVAVAEEVLFRGYLQSALSRASNETAGWLVSSLVFGAVHALNLPAVEEEQRDEYLLYGLPVITAAGAYLGWTYRHEDYALSPPVAIHFWYDFLLSATFFAIDPDSSILSARVRMPF